MNEPKREEGNLEALLLQIRNGQIEQKSRDLRRNRLLAWVLAWSLLLPAFVGGGYYLVTSQNAEVDTTADVVEVDTRTPAYTCEDIGDWVLETLDTPSDYYLGQPILVAPEGLRHYERVCLISLEPKPATDYVTGFQVAACGDHIGIAKGGGGNRDGMEMCLAILRANYL